MDSSGHWKPSIVMVAINFALAIVNVFLKKVFNAGLNHIIVVTYRMAIACAFLAPFAYFWERKSRPKLIANILLHFFLSALIGATFSQYLFLVGLGYTSATFSVAFTNLVPAFTFLLTLLFRQETVNIRTNAGRAKVLGTLICVAGAMVLTFYQGAALTRTYQETSTGSTSEEDAKDSSEKTEKWIVGSLCLTASCVVWSSWFLLQTRIGKKYPCQYSSTAFMSFFGIIQSAILSLIMERDFSKWVLRGNIEILGVTYAGAVGSGLCYVGMSWAVKHKGAVFTSAFTPLAQIFVAIFDYSLLHTQIYIGSVIGSVLVVIGLYILLWGRARSETEEPNLQQKQQSQVAEEAEDCNGRTQV